MTFLTRWPPSLSQKTHSLSQHTMLLVDVFHYLGRFFGYNIKFSPLLTNFLDLRCMVNEALQYQLLKLQHELYEHKPFYWL